MTPQELLLKAAEIIERDGWHQGGFFEYASTVEAWANPAGVLHAGETAPVCVIGAMNRAATGNAGLYTDHMGIAESRVKAVQLLAQIIGCPAIFTWNDAPERTAQDVILALKRAAVEGS